MVYPIFKRVVRILLKCFIKRVEGTENIPKKGGFLIVANHQSYLDPVVIFDTIMQHINQKIHFIAMDRLLKNPIRRLVWGRWAGCIPLSLDDKGNVALKIAKKYLKEGGIVAIFPEGPKKDARRIKGKTGAVRLALAARVPILPIGLKNVHKILPMEKWMPVKIKRIIEVKIGKPIVLDKYYGKEKDRRLLRYITDEVVMKRIVSLI